MEKFLRNHAEGIASMDLRRHPGFYAMLDAAVDCNHPAHAKAERFFHNFLLNDTFAPAKRVNLELAMDTVSRTCPTDY